MQFEGWGMRVVACEGRLHWIIVSADMYIYVHIRVYIYVYTCVYI